MNHAELSPDAAFALGALPREPAEVDVLVLRRGDAEATGGWWDGAAATDLAVREVDWLEENLRGSRRSVPYRAAQRLSQPLGRRWASAGGPAPGAASGILAGTYGRMARFLVDHGRRMLCQGRVVVTDRLHGHILCLLLGIPHVLVDNSYGKLRGFVDAWTAGAPGVRFASAPGDAPVLARELLGCDRTSTAALRGARERA